MVRVNFSEEHFALYRRHIESRHADGTQNVKSIIGNFSAQRDHQFFGRIPRRAWRFALISVVDQTASDCPAIFTRLTPR